MAKKKNAKKAALYVFYAALTVCILFTILSFNDLGEIGQVLMHVNYRYIWIAVAFLAIYAFTYPLTTCVLAKAQKLNVGFGTTYSIAMTEHFFNGITPFATGGQPFQVYAFTKAKVKAADSTGMLMMNFIIFMIVTNSFAVLSLIYYSKFVTNLTMQIIAIVGFTMNFGVLAFIIALATSKRLRGALIAIIKWLCKFKWINKLLAPKVPVLNEYFENVQSAFKALFKKGWAFVVCLILKVISMGAYYAITFFILRALGIGVGYNEIFFVICGTSFAITMVVFLPTPGSSGGIEFAFSTVFANIAGGAAAAVANGGMLIWRLLSYYLMMLVSLCFYIGLEIYFKVKNNMAKKREYTVTAGEGTIPICYSGNRDVFQGIVLSVLSILKHVKRNIQVFVMTMDLTDVNEKFKPIEKSQIDKLDKIAKSYGEGNSVVLLDNTEEFKERLLHSKNVVTGYTPYSMSRLLLDLYDVPQKIIYVDTDTMCCSDIAQLYDIDMDGREFAASLDIVGHNWVRPTYCNSGVLLLNLDEIKMTGLFERARKRVNKRKMIMPDQSALNFLSKSKLILPYKFNEQRGIKEDTVIKHFCQGFKWYGPFFKLYNYKQWDREAVHEKLKIFDFDEIYEEYDELDKVYRFEE